jgi:hypothetical protein
MGMGMWNVHEGDKVTVHYTYSKQENPPRPWTVRIGEIGLCLPTAQFNDLARQMLAARRAH